MMISQQPTLEAHNKPNILETNHNLQADPQIPYKQKSENQKLKSQNKYAKLMLFANIE